MLCYVIYHKICYVIYYMLFMLYNEKYVMLCYVMLYNINCDINVSC